MDELIYKKDVIKAICEDGTWLESQGCTEITMAERKQRDVDVIEDMPTVQAEPLTDAEQRIFLAAMEKERAVCKKLTDEWDGMKLDVPCPVNLLRLCAEIERKVKAALWTN